MSDFDRYNREVVSLAVLGDDNPRWRPERFNYGRWGCRAGIRFPVVKLNTSGRHYTAEDPPNSVFRNGVVDEAEEMETSPPYPYPLRGIQVKIRVFEPDSRQIREVTVVQEFVGK